MPDAAPPPLVATIGLHASASTWVFNVVRELLIHAAGEGAVVALYADRVEQLPDAAGRHLLLKSHAGSAALDDWLAARAAPIFVSLRDPRDAAISMAQRFATPLAHTARWLADDCARLLRLPAQPRLVLRYEDRFFEDPATVEHLAYALGVRPEPALVGGIFARYRTEAVAAFARGLADLPAERLTQVGQFAMDRQTQILAPHIGDGRSGKWRDLPEPARRQLTLLFQAFLARFGYPP